MEERRDERLGITVPGRYRTGRGMALDVTLRDLSKGGCQIHDRLGRLEVDQFVTIRIGHIGPIDSRVRWIEGRVAGIRFEQPLAESVLEHIRVIAEKAGYTAQAAPPRASPAHDTQSMGTPRSVRRLDLLDQERNYNDLIGALALGHDSEEVLAGLDRKDSEWLIRWRREKRSEREVRPSFRGDKPRAERLEELHEEARKLQQRY